MAWRWPDSLTHICGTRGRWVNSMWLCNTICRSKNWSSLVQLMACSLFDVKPLQWTNDDFLIALLRINISETCNKTHNFSLNKMLSKLSSAKCPPFPGPNNVLNHFILSPTTQRLFQVFNSFCAKKCFNQWKERYLTQWHLWQGYLFINIRKLRT